MRRFARFLLPLLFCVIGLAAGAWISIGRRAANFSAGVQRRLAENAEAASASTPGIKRAYSSDEEMLTAIMSAVAEEEPLLRAHRLHDLLGGLDSGELAVLFDRTMKVDDRERRAAVLVPLLARWAALDPAAASAAVLPYRTRFRKMGRIDWRGPDAVVDLAWTQAQPAPALAEALAAPDAPWAWNTATMALQALAEDDPARQLDLLASLPASRLRAGVSQSVINALAEKDSAAAEARLDLLTDPRKRALAEANILGKLTERDPSAGLARLAALAPGLTAGKAGTQLVSSVLRAAAKKDPSAALAALAGLPEDLQTRALGAVLVGWAGEHPTDALEWAMANGVNVAETQAMDLYPDDDRSGWTSLFNAALRSDHDQALAWLRAQPATRERDTMARDAMWTSDPAQTADLYNALTPDSQPSAVSWMMNKLGDYGTTDRGEAWANDLPPGPARTAAVGRLAADQAGNTPERIDRLADAWPAGPERDAALGGIVSNLLNSNPPRALDFARRVEDPAVRETTFENIAAGWLNHDEAAARAWISGTPDLSAEEKRVILRRFTGQ